MMRNRSLPMLAVAMLTGCAAGRADPAHEDAAELAAVLTGRTAGAEQRCIAPTRNSGPQIVGDHIVYREGRRLWVSAPVDACPSLRGDPILIIELQGSQLCRNDRFRTVPRFGNGIPGPYCRFDNFVPWTRIER